MVIAGQDTGIRWTHLALKNHYRGWNGTAADHTGICGIPSSARAVAINLAVFLPTDDGDLRVYPAGGAAPLASSINFRPGIVRANNAVVQLGAGGQLSVQCDVPSGSTHFFFDVYGYFQ